MESLTPAARDLLAAIRDALDIPHVAVDADTAPRERLLRLRAIAVLGVTDAILDCGATPSAAAETLRNRVGQTPVTYPTHERTEVPQ